jgi:hypothetical protein
MTEPEHRTMNGEPTSDRGRPVAAVRTTAQVFEPIAAMVEAVQGSVRESQDAAAGLMQRWTGQMTGIPFTALTRGTGAIMSGRVWFDCTFEMVDALLTVQRRSLDRLLGIQQAAGPMVESGVSRAAGSDVAGGSRAMETTDPRRPAPGGGQAPYGV